MFEIGMMVNEISNVLDNSGRSCIFSISSSRWRGAFSTEDEPAKSWFL